MIDLEKLKEDIQNLPKSVDDLAQPYIKQFKEDYGVSDDINTVEDFNNALDSLFSTGSDILRDLSNESNPIRRDRRASTSNEISTEYTDFLTFRSTLPDFEKAFENRQKDFKDKYKDLISAELDSYNTRVSTAIRVRDAFKKLNVASLEDFYKEYRSLNNNIRNDEAELLRLDALSNGVSGDLNEEAQNNIKNYIKNKLKPTIKSKQKRLQAFEKLLNIINDVKPIKNGLQDLSNFDSLEKEYDLLMELKNILEQNDQNYLNSMLVRIEQYEGINAKGKDVPSDDAKGKDVPSDDDKGKDVPSDDDKGKDVPSDDDKGKDVPSDDDKGKDVPSDDDKGKDVPSDDDKGKDVPSDDDKGKDVPSDDDKGKDVPSDDDKGKNDIYDTLKNHVEEATKKLSDAKEEFDREFKLSTLNTQDLNNFENKHFEDIDKFIALCNNLLSNIDNPEIAKENSGYNKFIADYNDLMSEVTNAKQVALNKEQAGQTPPMPKEEDDPKPDNYKNTDEYSSLMKGIKTLEKNINEAKKYFLDHFEDLDIASADDLNTFESIYLEQINEVNISSCETFLEIINNPELYEESGFNKLKAEADELNKWFEEVKESIQAREQAGQTPPPVENEDKDDENLEDVYFNLTAQIMDKVRNGICLQYGIDETNSLSSNTSTSDLEKFFGSLNIYASLKPTNFKNIYDYLPYFYIDSSNIDNFISDCHTILGKLDEVIQNLEIQKQQEEAGKGGKDDDDSKAGSGKDIYNNLLAELSALEALISNTENNIDYYDSTPNNSKTLLDLQTNYNNIDQKIRENKTIMPEYLHTQLTSRLNKCKERIDTIDYNIDNPPPKPVEPKTHIEFKEKYVVGDQEFDRRIRST